MHRQIITVLLAAAFAAGLGACATTSGTSRSSSPSADQASFDSAPIATPTATLVVEGLSCPLCASNVDEQLLRVPGVRSADVDLGTGRVKVTLADSGRPSARALAAAVEESGYTLVDIETP